MAKIDFIEKAKGVKHSAHEHASRFRDHAAGNASGLKEQLGNKVNVLKEVGSQKLVESLRDFNDAIPILGEAGYTVEGVDIEIGLPPKIIANFRTAGEVNEVKIEQILAANTEKRFTTLLVKSLHQACKLQNQVSIVGLKPQGISIEVGLVPTVIVKFA